MPPIVRRDFLKRAGAAAPLLSISSSWAAASDRIRVAVIGMGGRGRDHMNALARIDGVEVAAFCDPDEERMSESAAQFESLTGRRPRLEPDLRRVLEDRSIDAITIAAPNHWHALATIWGCQAGKHVYVEKPVAHDMAEGKMMVAAARKYNRIVQGGTQRRSNPNILRAIKALHGGIIGDLYMARCIHFFQRDSIGFRDPENDVCRGQNPSGISDRRSTVPVRHRPGRHGDPQRPHELGCGRRREPVSDHLRQFHRFIA